MGKYAVNAELITIETQQAIRGSRKLLDNTELLEQTKALCLASTALLKTSENLIK